MKKIINKSKVSILTSILFIGVLFVASIENAFSEFKIANISCEKNATTVPSGETFEGSTGAGTGWDKACSGANFCYSTMGSQGLRFALVEDDGTVVSKAFDYWFIPRKKNEKFHLTREYSNFPYKRYIVYVATDKKMIQEKRESMFDPKGNVNSSAYTVYHNNSDDSTVKSIVDDYSNQSIEDIFPNILGCSFSINGKGKTFTSSYGGGNISEENHEPNNLYYTQSQNAVVKILLDDNDTSHKYLEDLYTLLRANLTKDISKVSEKQLYIQIEPLVQFSMINVPGKWIYNYVGSFADVWFMTHYDKNGESSTGVNYANSQLFEGWLLQYDSSGYWKDQGRDFTRDGRGQFNNFFTDDFSIVAIGNLLHPETKSSPIPSKLFSFYKKEIPDNKGDLGDNYGWLKYVNNNFNFYFRGSENVMKKTSSGKYNTFGVTFIRASNIPMCNTVASNDFLNNSSLSANNVGLLNSFLANYKKAWTEGKSDAAKNKVKTLADAIRYLRDNYGSDATAKENIVGNYSTTANRLVVNKVFGYKYTDYCSTTTCDEVLTKLKKEKKLNKSNINLLSLLFGKYEFIKWENLLALYGDVFTITKNGKTVPDEAKIATYAKCGDAPKCIVPSVNAKCDKSDGNSFTIMDFTDDNGKNRANAGHIISNVDSFFEMAFKGDCLKSGIAYNGYNDGTVHSTSIQNAYETYYYGTKEKPAVCWEAISFNLPGNVNNIEAGTVFKWGKNSKDKDNNKFGTMTVNRYCTVTNYGQNIAAGKSHTIASYWVLPDNDNKNYQWKNGPDIKQNSLIKQIGTKVKLNYKQALPKGTTVQNSQLLSKNTNLELARLNINMYSVSNGKITQISDNNEIYYSCGKNGWNEDYLYGNGTSKCSDKWDNKNGNPFTYTCFNDNTGRLQCKNLASNNFSPIIFVTATYDILYDDDLKWYSDKSDNYSKKTASKITDGVDNAKYVSLGYGFPTSFVTPPLPATGDYYYGKNLSSSSTGGYMYAEISNIGTRKGTSYHFDKLKQAITDDDPNSNDTIKYSCGFNIQNKLYCFECSPNPPKGCKNGICKPEDSVPKGIDVVFRTVELIDTKSAETNVQKITRAFPGRSGSGRNIGDNWDFDKKNAELEAKIGEKNVAGKIITQLLNNNIYESSPKYVIDLNPVVIQDIRKENKKDSYTSMSEYIFKKHSSTRYTTPDLNKAINECKDDNKNGCRRMSFLYRTFSEANNNEQLDYSYTYGASPFLSELMSKKRLTGTCAEEIDTGKRAETFAESYGC